MLSLILKIIKITASVSKITLITLLPSTLKVNVPSNIKTNNY